MPGKPSFLVTRHLGDRVPEKDELVVRFARIFLACLRGSDDRHGGQCEPVGSMWNMSAAAKIRANAR